MRIIGALLASWTMLVGSAAAQTPEASPEGLAIEDGSEVSLEYTLTDDKGKLLESNKGRSPLTFTQGEHQIIPGLESAVTGMRAGEEKTVVVQPADGYGNVDPDNVTEVAKQMLPPDALIVGAHLIARSRDGDARLVRVKEIKDTTVIIDLNHPLAGKVLHFDLKVLQVAPPKK